MSKTFRLSTSIFLIAFLLGICAACAPATTANPAQKPILQLHDCHLISQTSGVSISARCGKLPVYEDQNTHSGRQIELNIAVIPAISRNPQPDPLFLLAGGPGQAATETFLPILAAFDRINQKHDLVLVDQRGTGTSHPLRCPSSDIADKTESNPQKDEQMVKDCLAGLDADTRLYTTSSSVEDLEQVRQALGYGHIDLLGVSYGTRYALAYLRQYPQNVRTVILDSVVPLGWQIGSSTPENAQRALNMLFDRCAADAGCQKAFPDLRQDFDSVMAALDKAPVKVTLAHPSTGEPITLTLTRDSIASMIHALTYTPETTALVPLLIHTARVSGDYQRLAAEYLIVVADLEQSMSSGLQLSVLCAEDIPTTSEGAVEPTKATSYLQNPDVALEPMCKLWPHAEVPPEFNQPVQSDVPVLLLSGEADPITPPANGDQAARTLTHSLHLVIPGMGHNVIYRGCVPRIAADFIDSGSTANLNTQCIQKIQPVPFFLNFNGPTP